MLSSIALLGRDDGAPNIKEGSVAVRGRYIVGAVSYDFGSLGFLRACDSSGVTDLLK